MSYAALLALLSALAFALPFLVRLAQAAGIPRSSGIALTLAFITVASTYLWLRWRLRDQDALDALEPGVLPSEPYVPGFFFEGGAFRGERLRRQGRTREALAVYRAYQAILERQGQRQADIDAVVLELVSELGREEDGRASV